MPERNEVKLYASMDSDYLEKSVCIITTYDANPERIGHIPSIDDPDCEMDGHQFVYINDPECLRSKIAATKTYFPQINFGCWRIGHDIPDGQMFPHELSNALQFLYDTFDSSVMDPGKWMQSEVIRKVSDGKLYMELEAVEDQLAYYWLPFADPGSITSFRADVTVQSFQAENTNVAAEIVGAFYNDGVGNIYAEVRLSGR